jgi:anti-repressor protein
MVEQNGEPWFVGKDVADALGYSNSNKAIKVHVDSEDRKVLEYKGFSQNGNTSELWSGNDFSNKTIINESGLYSLIMSSKLPKAKEFKHWVTSEVLPSIRKQR